VIDYLPNQHTSLLLLTIGLGGMTQPETSSNFLHTTIPSLINIVYLDELMESTFYFNPVLYVQIIEREIPVI